MFVLLALGCSFSRSGEASDFDARGGSLTTLPVTEGASCEAAYRAYTDCYYGVQGIDDEVSDADVAGVCDGYGPEWDATFACWLAIIQQSACQTEEDVMEIQEAVQDCPFPEEYGQDTGGDEER